jgi:hypothetical protein
MVEVNKNWKGLLLRVNSKATPGQPPTLSVQLTEIAAQTPCPFISIKNSGDA